MKAEIKPVVQGHRVGAKIVEPGSLNSHYYSLCYIMPSAAFP